MKSHLTWDIDNSSSRKFIGDTLLMGRFNGGTEFFHFPVCFDALSVD